MNVIDRYLLAVQAFLPRATQRDIITELSEDIRSRVEDQETGLGRPLTGAEQERLVKALGHPALLAGRYGPRRQLIGPEIFPFYWLVLKLALSVGIAVHVGFSIAMFATGKTDQALRQINVVLPLVAFLQFGIITIVFAALDAYGVLSRFNRGWSPHTLPSAAGRAQPVFQLAFTAFFAVWWFAALRQPFLIFGPGAAVARLAPIWQSLFMPMMLLALAEIAWQTIGLVRPQWRRVRAAIRIALSGLELAVVYVLARAGEWVVIADAARQLGGREHLVDVLNKFVLWSLPFVAVVLIITMVFEVRTIRQGAIQTL